MKRYIVLFIVLFFYVSAHAQLEVKPDSFKEVPGFVNINLDIQSDDNDVPYAVLKIKTENINDKQRRELLFQGDAATFFEVEYKVGEVWVYLSHYATFLKISHPDLSSTEFWFPFDMEPKKGYELTLLNNTKTSSGYGTLTITSKPESGATISINGDIMTYKTPHTFDMFPSGTYNVTISKEKYKTVTKNITIKSGEKQNIEFDMPFAYGFLSIQSTPSDAIVSIDGRVCGKTPLSVNQIVGNHNIEISKTGYKSYIKDANILEDDTLFINTLLAELYDITISASGYSNKIYIDGNYEGHSPVTRHLSLGKHIVKVVRSYPNNEEFEQEINIEPGGEKEFHILLPSDIKAEEAKKGIAGSFLRNIKSRDERVINFDIGVYAGLGLKSMMFSKCHDRDIVEFSVGAYTLLKHNNLGLKIAITSRKLNTSGYFFFNESVPSYSDYYMLANYFHFSTTNIPIMIGYEYDKIDALMFSAYIGPQINICNSATYDIGTSDKNNTSYLNKNLSVDNYEQSSWNLCGELNLGYCYKYITLTFISFKFDLTREILVRDGANTLIEGDIGYRSFIFAMQLDLNF